MASEARSDVTLDTHDFADGAALAEALAVEVATRLRQAIEQRGHALLALSGGNTPRRFLEQLAQQPLDWPAVIVTLVDERWVPAEHPRANARLLAKHLFTGAAANARFVPLYTAVATPEKGLDGVAAQINALPLPLDVAILGMGTDGHTASFFPGGDHLDEALDPACPARVLPVRAEDAGEPRITLTLPVLIGARALYLHIEGEEKQRVFERARSGAELPIAHVLRHAPRLDIYWCP